jgi:hypothetical protein
MCAGVALLQANSKLLAQDIAEAARANRATSGASISAEALKTCVTDKTSGRDRKDLAKWVFFAMAAHPEMKPYADDKTAAASEESSKTAAALITRLLTDSCVNEVRAVMQTGQGSQAVRFAFETLGQLAMRELMTDKAVQDAMNSVGRYVDQPRINEALVAK